jgi:hypothetical protein
MVSHSRPCMHSPHGQILCGPVHLVCHELCGSWCDIAVCAVRARGQAYCAVCARRQVLRRAGGLRCAQAQCQAQQDEHAGCSRYQTSLGCQRHIEGAAGGTSDHDRMITWCFTSCRAARLLGFMSRVCSRSGSCFLIGGGRGRLRLTTLSRPAVAVTFIWCIATQVVHACANDEMAIASTAYLKRTSQADVPLNVHNPQTADEPYGELVVSDVADLHHECSSPDQHPDEDIRHQV